MLKHLSTSWLLYFKGGIISNKEGKTKKTLPGLVYAIRATGSCAAVCKNHFGKGPHVCRYVVRRYGCLTRCQLTDRVYGILGSFFRNNASVWLLVRYLETNGQRLGS